MADRYLLESGAPDGYLLEDSSGVLLLEGASGPPPRSPMRNCLHTILASFCIVTIAPLFTSVVLANTSDPPAVHASRQIETQAVIRSLHSEPAWDAQWARKLPASVTAVPVDSPPPLTERYLGEFALASWDTQARPKLIPVAVTTADTPPIRSSAYRGEWPPLEWPTQKRAGFTPGSEINDPPYSGKKYAGEWPALTWDAQARTKLVTITPASVDAPPPSNPDALYGPLASHYTPPTASPLWGATLTVEGAASAPVNDPPFGMRNRQSQLVDLSWSPRPLTAISLGRYSESVDAPPQLAQRYRGEWPPLTWDTQARQHIPILLPPVVDNPPFSGKKYAGDFTLTTWEAQTTRKVTPPIEGSTVVAGIGLTWRPIWGRRRRL